MPSIAGQSVLVIGGSSGIGFAVARLALSEQASVAIASSSTAKVDAAVQRLKADAPGPAQVTGYTVDLCAPDPEQQLDKLFADATSHGQHPLDHIILTAGRPKPLPVAEADLEQLIAAARLPVFVNILVAKLAPKYLDAGPRSSIIFTSGQVAEKPIPGYSALASFAIAGYALTRNLAVDLAPRRVNLVSPGATDTELWGDRAEAMREMVAKKSLLGKPGLPEEVAEAYLYLMRNTDATGSIVSTNAGGTLQ
jgi:NAD(P)-dependent dehydrogenase (short-subunit alcohol dehydrogenase family)